MLNQTYEYSGTSLQRSHLKHKNLAYVERLAAFEGYFLLDWSFSLHNDGCCESRSLCREVPLYIGELRLVILYNTLSL